MLVMSSTNTHCHSPALSDCPLAAILGRGKADQDEVESMYRQAWKVGRQGVSRRERRSRKDGRSRQARNFQGCGHTSTWTVELCGQPAVSAWAKRQPAASGYGLTSGSSRARA